MILFAVGIVVFWQTASNTVDYLIHVSGLKEWMENTDNGFLSFMISLAGLIFTMLILVGYFSLFKYLWLILGSPVFAYISEKTESIIEGTDFPFSWTQLWKDALRGIRIALRNMLWQTVYTIAIFILSFIPVIGWAAPILALFIECYYYGFSMLDYSCERHRMMPQESIRFIGRHKGLAIGNGIVFYLMHLVPVLGWMFAPTYAVVSATISLYHRNENDI